MADGTHCFDFGLEVCNRAGIDLAVGFKGDLYVFCMELTLLSEIYHIKFELPSVKNLPSARKINITEIIIGCLRGVPALCKDYLAFNERSRLFLVILFMLKQSRQCLHAG